MDIEEEWLEKSALPLVHFLSEFDLSVWTDRVHGTIFKKLLLDQEILYFTRPLSSPNSPLSFNPTL